MDPPQGALFLFLLNFKLVQGKNALALPLRAIFYT
jgi:hypothetical protein